MSEPPADRPLTRRELRLRSAAEVAATLLPPVPELGTPAAAGGPRDALDGVPDPAPAPHAPAEVETGAGDPPVTGPSNEPAVPAAPEPGRPPPKANRAGRNMAQATAVGTGLGAVVVASLFIRSEAFVAVVVIVIGGAVWEFGRALATRGLRIPVLPLLVGSTGMLVSAFTAGPEALVVAFLITAGGVFVWRVLDGGGPEAVRDASAGILTAAYVPFLAGFMILMVDAPDGAWRVLYFICLVTANDTGGLLAGMRFGRRPLAPSISPKKSWEGAVGSFLLTGVVGVLLMWWFFDGPLLAGLAIGLLAVVAATVGDLAESLVKRDLGLKDMGSLLPGHGGIMDRIDSLLVAAPVVHGGLAVAFALAP